MSLPIHIEFCWAADARSAAIAGEPAYQIRAGQQQIGSAMMSRVIQYFGTASLSALLDAPEVADIAALINTGYWKVAVFGKPGRANMPIYDGDRIELLGPISADPKAARHAKVRAERKANPANRWQRRPD